MPECLLRAANGQPEVRCDEQECVYWRLVEQLDVSEQPLPQRCAIQHFRLLDEGAEVAAWLMSVKRRVESDGTTTDGS